MKNEPYGVLKAVLQFSFRGHYLGAGIISDGFAGY
jgi:hypothetical protein